MQRGVNRRSEMGSLHTLVKKSKKLPPDALTNLARRAAKDKDPRLRRMIVESELNMILAKVRSLQIMARTAGVDLEELFQAGVLGVYEALDRFDPTYGKGTRSFIEWHILSSMQKAIQHGRHSVSIYHQAFYIVNNPDKPSSRRHNADEMREGISRVTHAVSLNQPMPSGSKNKRTYAEVIGEGTEDDLIEVIPSNIIIPRALSVLTPQQKADITLKYLSNENLTLEEIGRRRGVSKQRVSDAIIRGLRKIRKVLLEEGLVDEAERITPEKHPRTFTTKKEEWLRGFGIPEETIQRWRRRIRQVNLKKIQLVVPLAVRNGVLGKLTCDSMRRIKDEKGAMKLIQRLKDRIALEKEMDEIGVSSDIYEQWDLRIPLYKLRFVVHAAGNDETVLKQIDRSNVKDVHNEKDARKLVEKLRETTDATQVISW